MTYPTAPLGVRIRIAPYAVDRSADPATYTWTDITSRVHHLEDITDTIGSTDDATESNTEFECVLRNDDGYMTTDNPESPYYPYWDLGCPIEYALDSGSGFVVQCITFLGSCTNEWPNDTPFKCIATVSAGGQFQRLGLDPPAASPVKRALLSRRQKAVWMLEDATGSTAAASSIPAQGPLTALAGVPPEFGQSPLVDGVASMVKFSEGTNLSAFFTTPTVGTGFLLSFLLQTDTVPAGQVSLCALYGLPGAAVNRFILEMGPGNLRFRAYDQAGNELSAAPGIAFTGHETGCVWVDLTLTSAPGIMTWGIRETTWSYNADGTIFSNSVIGAGSFAGTYGPQQALAFGPLRDVDDTYVAAVALSEYPANAAYLLGGSGAVLSWAGNKATERVQGMALEARIPFSVTAPNLGSVLGPQLPASFLANMRNIQATDHGILTDHLGVVAYRALSELYNLAPGISLSKTVKGQLGQLEPIRDDATKTNVTGAHRTGGSTVTVMDEDDIARSGTYERSAIEVNTLTDKVLPGHAGWALARGAARGYRYGALTLNMRVAAEYTPALPGQVMGLKLGDRIAVTSLPRQAGTEGITRMVTGRKQTVNNRGMRKWTVDYRLVPTEPYDAYVLNTTRLDASGAETILAATSADTVIMASMPEVTATVAGPGLGIPLVIAGERVTLSQVVDEPWGDTFTRVTANGWGSMGATAHLAAQAWAMTGTLSDYATTGTAATATINAAPQSKQGHLTGLSMVNYDMKVLASVPVLATGGNIELQMNYRHQLPANTGYFARLVVEPGATTRMQIFTPGATDPIADVPTSLSAHTAGQVYGLRVLVVGTRHRLKVWQGGLSAETAGWQVDVRDDSRTTAGYPVLRAGRGTGNTNAALVATFDSLVFNGIQAFTVARSANGVVKALPINSEIHVYSARGLGVGG